MFKIYDGREHFYQWDVDRKLIVNDASVAQVHFCNRSDNCSLVVETYQEEGLTLANVPNILLQNDFKIKVYAYDGKHTLYSDCFEVVKRTKPSDYAYTETEILNWEIIKKEITETNNAISETNNMVSNSLKGSASGETVVITDISPIEHNMPVTLSSESITDFSKVMLCMLGKNMINVNAKTAKELTFNRKENPYTRMGWELYPPPGVYTATLIPVNNDIKYVYGVINDAKGNWIENLDLYRNSGDAVTNLTPLTFKVNAGDVVIFYGARETEHGNKDLDGYLIQLEPGTKSTEYEEYKEPTVYRVEPDGTVNGVKSIYPSITLATNTPGVVVEAVYNRDLNKAFAELQEKIISLVEE